MKGKVVKAIASSTPKLKAVRKPTANVTGRKSGGCSCGKKLKTK